MTALEWRLYEAGHCTHPERATRRDGPLRACEFPALVALLRHPVHGWILFDTGYSEHFMAATQAFPERLYRWVTPVRLQPRDALREQLRRDGIVADDIAWILLSHLHADHIGGLADFPHARVALSREAWQDLHARSRLGALRVGLVPALLGARDAATLHWFEDSPALALEGSLSGFGIAHDLFGDGSVRLIALPGHAAGHYGLWFEDARGPVFLIGDAAWSTQAIRDNVPPPGAVTDWLGDTPVYRRTLARLHALHAADPRIRIVPSHCREWRPARTGEAAWHPAS